MSTRAPPPPPHSGSGYRLEACCCLQLDVLVLSNSRRRALFAVRCSLLAVYMLRVLTLTLTFLIRSFARSTSAV